MDEYLKVKDMTYLQYCDYLQSKYGIGKRDYYHRSSRFIDVFRWDDGLSTPEVELEEAITILLL